MPEFREKHPKNRRRIRTVKRYQDYKPDLKSDFNGCCGYCNDLDIWPASKGIFQIDHFVPRKYWKTITELDYVNLVYSCFYCNNSKRAKWPTKDEVKHNEKGKGFVNPKLKSYCTHLKRGNDGSIIPIGKLGNYMQVAMKLHLKRHAIIWNLSMIHGKIQEMEKIKVNSTVTNQILSLKNEFYSYFNDLVIANAQ